MAESLGGAADALAARLAALSPRTRELLERRLAAGGEPTRSADRRALPASFGQERLWLLDRIGPHGSGYVLTSAVRLRGPVDPGRLRTALAGVAARHEVLRTDLREVRGRPVQHVHNTISVPWSWTDLSADPDPLARYRALLAADAERGFDLGVAPLWRVRLVRLAQRDHVLGLVLRHEIGDAWSIGVLAAELGRRYAEPDVVPDPLPIQYGDVAARERARFPDGAAGELVSFWRSELSGAPDVVDLPTDRPRSPERSGHGGRHDDALRGVEPSALRRIGVDVGATGFMTYLTGFAVLLSRWSGVTDVVVGTPVAGRSDPCTHELVGFFANTVALRLDLSGDPTFRELLGRVRRTCLRAFSHQELPFDRLVEHLAPTRSRTHAPVVQVNFAVLDGSGARLELPDVVSEPADAPGPPTARFDLALYMEEQDGRMRGRWEFATDLFDPATVRALADGLGAVLRTVAADPDERIGALTVPAFPIPSRPVAPPGTAPPGTAPPGTAPPGTAPPGTAPGADPAAAEPAPRGSARPDDPFAPGPTDPRDRWERNVARTWSEILGVDGVRRDDDFFVLGGTSIAAMLVADRLRRLTGRPVEPADLFAYRTVEGLAGRLRRADGDSDGRFVVELRNGGERPPLFFFPAVIGELYLYFDLAAALGDERPLWGLQTDGFFAGGAEPGTPTMPEVATRYAEEIRRACPDGPYHLCGFSAAGRFAVATAERLRAAGAEVGVVAVLDTAPLGDAPPDPDLAFVLSRWLLYAPPAERLRGAGRAEQLDRVLAAGRRSGDLPPDLRPEEFARYCRRLELNAHAVAPYRPHYPGTVTLLLQRDRTDRDVADEWSRFPIGGLVVNEIDTGSHLGFVHGPALPDVAASLRRHMDDHERGVA